MPKRKDKKIKIVKKAKKTEAKSIEPETVHKTRIRVIGIGGGGGSIVAEVAPLIQKVDFLVANTDIQAIKALGRKIKVFQFGQALTKGLGCGMDPKAGKDSAKDAEQKIANLFKGADLAILVSCLGGGTGSGAAPEFARIAKELGVLTFGIFTMPFKFEGAKRAQIAKASLERLRPHLNVFSVIPNENIFKIINKDTPILEAFSAINKRLSENLRGLVEMIHFPGIINIDFADLQTILDGKGKLAYLNSAANQGQNRSGEATKALLESPLSEYGINGAEKILFNITASKDLAMTEVELISRTIFDFNRRARIIFGISQDNNYKNNLRITLLAVGCGQGEEKLNKSELEAEKDDPKLDPAPASKRENKPKQKLSPVRPGSELQRASKIQSAKNKKKLRPKINKKARHRGEKKTEAEARQVPLLAEDNKMLPRKNGLDLRREAEKTEQELFEEEKKWDTPAFLRKQESQ